MSDFPDPRTLEWVCEWLARWSSLSDGEPRPPGTMDFLAVRSRVLRDARASFSRALVASSMQSAEDQLEADGAFSVIQFREALELARLVDGDDNAPPAPVAQRLYRLRLAVDLDGARMRPLAAGVKLVALLRKDGRLPGKGT